MSNTEFFLVRIFLHSVWTWRFTPWISSFSPNTGKYGPEKLRVWRLNLGDISLFLLSVEGVVDPLCSPVFPKKKQLKVLLYLTFPNSDLNPSLILMREFLLFSLSELLNNKDNKVRYGCSSVFFVVSSIYCLYYAKDDTRNTSLFLLPLYRKTFSITAKCLGGFWCNFSLARNISFDTFWNQI